ncbi:MAG: hypothetical protein Q7S52_00900, partial [bacterium]|nr:hypothetical protein [bacterium]
MGDQFLRFHLVFKNWLKLAAPSWKLSQLKKMTPQNKKQQMLHNSSRILLYSSILQKTAIA